MFVAVAELVMQCNANIVIVIVIIIIVTFM